MGYHFQLENVSNTCNFAHLAVLHITQHHPVLRLRHNFHGFAGMEVVRHRQCAWSESYSPVLEIHRNQSIVDIISVIGQPVERNTFLIGIGFSIAAILSVDHQTRSMSFKCSAADICNCFWNVHRNKIRAVCESPAANPLGFCTDTHSF